MSVFGRRLFIHADFPDRKAVAPDVREYQDRNRDRPVVSQEGQAAFPAALGFREVALDPVRSPEIGQGCVVLFYPQKSSCNHDAISSAGTGHDFINRLLSQLA